jgi:hypothetical protein
VVEPVAGGVVTGDHRDAGGCVLGASVGPVGDHGIDCVVLGGVDRDVLGLVIEVVVGVAVVQGGERVAFDAVVLADHLA